MASTPRRFGRILIGLALLSWIWPAAAAEPDYRQLTGRVVTIEDYGYQLGRHWGIGTKEKDNGVLLIVAPNERKVRVEVGRGLEPILTDAMSKIIINGAILPRFRAGDYAGALVVIFWALIILWFIWVMWRSTQRFASRGTGPIFIPGPGWGGGSGGSDWGGANGRGGSSGGGGSFGGRGDASGGW